MTDNVNLTFGQRACGVNFNPGQNPDVAAIKAKFANLVDDLHSRRYDTNDPEVKRMLSTAITEVQTAQMWAVKAVTWNT